MNDQEAAQHRKRGEPRELPITAAARKAKSLLQMAYDALHFATMNGMSPEEKYHALAFMEGAKKRYEAIGPAIARAEELLGRG
jgi:hypothetical protein